LLSAGQAVAVFQGQESKTAETLPSPPFDLRSRSVQNLIQTPLCQ